MAYFAILLMTVTTLCFSEATVEWMSRPRSTLYVNAGKTGKIRWKFPPGAKAITYEKKRAALENGVRIAYKFDAGLVIVGSYINKIRIEESGALSILKASLKDEGIYCITVTYTNNTLIDEVKIIIQEAPVITTFPVHSKRDVFYIGMTINLLCMARGRPVPEVQWFKEGIDKPLQTASGSLLRQIKRASKDDSGKYSCTATNNAGQHKRTIEFVILRRPYNVEFFHNTALDGTIYEGQSVIFTCSAKGNPPISYYKLLHNGREIDKISNGVYEINEVRYENNGTYCCIPMNKAGLGQNKTLVLRVEARPSYWKEKLKRTTVPSTTEAAIVTTKDITTPTDELSTQMLQTTSKVALPRGAGNIREKNLILLSSLYLLTEIFRHFVQW